MSGAYGNWRGRPVEIAGTWNDNNQAMLGLWALRPSGDLGNWDKPLDIAVGAIGTGETWQAAAGGAYDARWRESLTSLKKLWSGRSGTWYLRFAHEMNGNWYAWSVNSGNAAAFTKAWNRYRALQQEIFPESKLVFNVNRETVGNNADWRKYWPGKENVDVFGVDYYNAYPYVATKQDWAASMKLTDGVGAPKGLQGHLDFARSQGLPMSISEWSGTAANGDNVAFMQGMYEFLQANGGSGAGQVLYEILFNVNVHNNSYRVFNGTAMPKAAEAYRSLW
ncbi:hypothetical protein GB931_08440 [Modestobacter sp. I12A-02628]|uniref:GH26 domain-containing protein n=1 Tax=Goekera deserti TaxID=2497753 RepID=A0A7K3WEV4_9ACTN|nr:glycosyl hydrolase [Goekera deserti]MPQ97950.1 hypothetical protein [Goekera deserti]NDI48596.1 hypothetical protein [Goekera deserti]NEL55025.1 hypothetical protein [Goekera deserti]